MTKQQYIADVLREYTALTHTPDRHRLYDRRLAGELYDLQVSRDTVYVAFVLAIVRRSVRPASEPPLDPIRSLAYFRPIIRQLLDKPLDQTYIDYMAYRYRRILADPASATRVTAQT